MATKNKDKNIHQLFQKTAGLRDIKWNPEAFHEITAQSFKAVHNIEQRTEGSSGIWTRDLSHPKRESYP